MGKNLQLLILTLFELGFRSIQAIELILRLWFLMRRDSPLSSLLLLRFSQGAYFKSDLFSILIFLMVFHISKSYFTLDVIINKTTLRDLVNSYIRYIINPSAPLVSTKTTCSSQSLVQLTRSGSRTVFIMAVTCVKGDHALYVKFAKLPSHLYYWRKYSKRFHFKLQKFSLKKKWKHNNRFWF